MDEILKCSNCGVSFEAVRASAKFCSDKCRNAYRDSGSKLAGAVEEPLAGVSVSHKGLCHQAKDCNHSHADRITFIPNWIRLENPSKDLEALVDIVRKKLNAVTS